MTKSRTMSAPKAGARSSFQLWTARKNEFFSSLLEGTVTNRQVLLIIHCLIAFLSFVFFSGHLAMAAITMIWFILSLYSARKGGLK